MEKSKILFLGASISQIPPLLYSKRQNYHIITCDNIPDNAGHKYADESYNISTTDKESVFQLAQNKRIDAIIAYGSDPAASTAAYVGNKLGLPANPYESVCILTNKNLYRQFLQQHNFNYPQFIYADNLSEANNGILNLNFPVMVKPVDSSGSKGVSKISSPNKLANAFNYAIGFSRRKLVIIEEYIEKNGYQIAGDAFLQNGKVAFHCLANEHFNEKCNPHVPIGESFPSILDDNTQQVIIDEIQRLISLLNMKIGAINIDAMIDTQGKIYLMEIGPRNGGNSIPEVIKHATGVDLIAHTVECALGNYISLQKKKPTNYYASYIIHSENHGTFKDITIDDDIKAKIVHKNMFVKNGDKIYPFNGSQFALGRMIINFASQEDMLRKMHDNSFVSINSND